MPDFLRIKSWEASEELDVIGRAGGVCAIIFSRPLNGVGLVGNQLKRGDDIPNFQVLGKLNRRAEPGNRADPSVVCSLLCDRAILPSGYLIQV
jgi:hypothetical protein